MYMYWNADFEMKLRKYRGFDSDTYSKHDMFADMEELFKQREMMVIV